MDKIGRRIVVYGSTGSGKSTLAQLIAQRAGLPYVELDAIFWLPDWVEKPLEEFRVDALTVLDSHPDGWVCDGNYGRIRGTILPLADTVVWLRLPFRITFRRLLKRTVVRCLDKKLVCGNNRETVRQSFFSRDSLLLYAWKHRRGYDERIGKDLEEIPHSATIHRLYSARDVKRFLG